MKRSGCPLLGIGAVHLREVLYFYLQPLPGEKTMTSIGHRYTDTNPYGGINSAPATLTAAISEMAANKILSSKEISNFLAVLGIANPGADITEILKPLADQVASGQLKITDIEDSKKLAKALKAHGLNSSTFKGKANSASWHRGSGFSYDLVRPHIEVDVVSFPQFEIKSSAKADNRAMTIVITLAGTPSGPQNGKPNINSKLEIVPPANLMIYERYTVYVQDEAGNNLLNPPAQIDTMLAPTQHGYG